MSPWESDSLANDRSSMIQGTNKQLELTLCATMMAVPFGYFDIEDDFVFIGSHNSSHCSRSLSKALQVCAMLGMPVSLHKIDSPSTLIIFLGVEIDSVACQLRLSQLKLFCEVMYDMLNTCSLHHPQQSIYHCGEDFGCRAWT